MVSNKIADLMAYQATTQGNIMADNTTIDLNYIYHRFVLCEFNGAFYYIEYRNGKFVDGVCFKDKGYV